MVKVESVGVADTDAPPLVPADQAIDLEHLARMTLGEHALEREVLSLFDRQAGMLLGRMRDAGPAIMAAFAHTLKGSARGIGAWRVAEAAEALESGAAAASPDAADGSLQRLVAAVDEVKAEIAAILRRDSAA
jgi:HPt (histidine-containing phosphotransfer) domain-containing protein